MINAIIRTIALLVAIAYYTLAERKIMGAIQRRRGPNVVGFWGLLQPLADGLKLMTKELIIPSHANNRIFVLAPLFVFMLSLLAWSVLPCDCGDTVFLAVKKVAYYDWAAAIYKSPLTYATILGGIAGSMYGCEAGKAVAGLILVSAHAAGVPVVVSPDIVEYSETNLLPAMSPFHSEVHVNTDQWMLKALLHCYVLAHAVHRYYILEPAAELDPTVIAVALLLVCVLYFGERVAAWIRDNIYWITIEFIILVIVYTYTYMVFCIFGSPGSPPPNLTDLLYGPAIFAGVLGGAAHAYEQRGYTFIASWAVFWHTLAAILVTLAIGQKWVEFIVVPSLFYGAWRATWKVVHEVEDFINKRRWMILPLIFDSNGNLTPEGAVCLIALFLYMDYKVSRGEDIFPPAVHRCIAWIRKHPTYRVLRLILLVLKDFIDKHRRRVPPLLLVDYDALIEPVAVGDVRYSLLVILAISSFSVYWISLAGWSSNSKYSFLGALRSAAQMVSYEVSISLALLPVVALSGSLNLTEIVLAQAETVWFSTPLLPMALVFGISMVAETNRTPFDLPEAEAELVAGYNVEYSSITFAMFFLAEYGNMILAALIYALFFFGGWLRFSFVVKGLTFAFIFVLIRATLPRYRYDQLMDIGWKVFLPTATAYFIAVIDVVFAFRSAPINKVWYTL